MENGQWAEREESIPIPFFGRFLDIHRKFPKSTYPVTCPKIGSAYEGKRPVIEMVVTEASAGSSRRE
jgi:hypothetical protein